LTDRAADRHALPRRAWKRGRDCRRAPRRHSERTAPPRCLPLSESVRRQWTVAIERHSDHWRWIGGPVPPGADAITLWSLISIRESAAGDAQLMRHELVHVRQWRRFGVVGFLVRYLGAYFGWRLRGYGHWAAYRRIPFEVEAEWVARRSRIT